MTIPGEAKAWEELAALVPEDVCRSAAVSYNNRSTAYTLNCMGMDFSISPSAREIKGLSEDGSIFLKRFSYFFNLSVLRYLVSAKDIPLSGQLVKPVNIKGGHLFFRGSHVLPLDRLAEKYGGDKEGFIARCKALNGKVLNHGDASFELFPMPRIPVTLILWLSDDEFYARADLLFDSTCELHLPIDIIWSIAMMSLLGVIG